MSSNVVDAGQAVTSTAAFKSAMRNFCGSVCVITSVQGANTSGLTATSVSCLSVDPPTLLISVNTSSDTHKIIEASDRFCVSLLAEDQSDIADQFAGRSGKKGSEKFEGIDWLSVSSGSRYIECALAWFDCRVIAAHKVHSHTIFVGEVEGMSTNQFKNGLLYSKGHYVGVTPVQGVQV